MSRQTSRSKSLPISRNSESQSPGKVSIFNYYSSLPTDCELFLFWNPVLQPSTCLICARPAKGFHCDVASCKGCKTFFRRMCTLPTDKTNIKCLVGNDQCFTRAGDPMILRCRACRYQKCISVGMNPRALELNEEESKAVNYQKLQKRHSESQKQIAEKQVIRTLESVDNKLQRTVDMLTYLESKLEIFRCSAYNPNWADVQRLEIFLQVNSKIGIAEKMGPMPGWPVDVEEANLAPGKEDFWKNVDDRVPIFNPTVKMWMFFDLMTAVEYAKTFEFFHKLNLADRVILMRHVAVVIMNLHISYFSVTSKFENIMNPDGSMLPFVGGKFGFAWQLAMSPLIRCRLTKTEYVLLKGICFCNPTVGNLLEHAQTVIFKERDRYANALFDYCQRTRNDGVNRYVEILGLVGLLERQQKMQKDLHLTFVAPLVVKLPESIRNPLIDDIVNY